MKLLPSRRALLPSQQRYCNQHCELVIVRQMLVIDWLTAASLSGGRGKHNRQVVLIWCSRLHSSIDVEIRHGGATLENNQMYWVLASYPFARITQKTLSD